MTTFTTTPNGAALPSLPVERPTEYAMEQKTLEDKAEWRARFGVTAKDRGRK